MKYADGKAVRLGDRVKLGKDDNGIVVCSIDTGEYSQEHPEAQWGYLKKGVMIEFPMYGLIHYEEPEPVKLTERCTAWRAEDIHELIKNLSEQTPNN